MERIAFRECTMTKLDDLFGLKQLPKIETLSNWLSMSCEVTGEEKKPLIQLQNKFNQNWNFMLLEGKKYVISKRFVADDEEFFDVFRILKCLKMILLANFENDK